MYFNPKMLSLQFFKFEFRRLGSFFCLFRPIALRHLDHSLSFRQEYDPPFKNGVSLELAPNAPAHREPPRCVHSAYAEPPPGGDAVQRLVRQLAAPGLEVRSA